jgi:phosphatidylglycerol---prolipoprotein diacylglyceryl transferase
MRSTLFFIPHELLGLPMFGVGWLLLVLVVAYSMKVVYRRRLGLPWSKAAEDWLGWTVAAAVVIFLLPRLETLYPDADGKMYPVGLPVRGYGLFLMLGVLSAVWITAIRAKPLGLSLDNLMSLSVTTVIGGVLGARLFFVIQKWEELPGATLAAKLFEAVKFTEGGLVVFGSFIGGAVAVIWWSLRRRQRLLVMGDMLAPGLMIGLCLGRLGCFMNGCCYAGVCDNPSLPTVQFPKGSLAYMEQVQSGELLGMKFSGNVYSALGAETVSIQPGSWAEQNALKVGDRVTDLRLSTIPPALGNDPAGPPDVEGKIIVANQTYFIGSQLPKRSLPVHPIQLYASLSAGLTCAFLFTLWPVVRRDGLILAAWLIMAGVSRLLEEWIRIDEKGQFGTELTISQWISLGGILGGGILLIYVCLQPPARRQLARNSS